MKTMRRVELNFEFWENCRLCWERSTFVLYFTRQRPKPNSHYYTRSWLSYTKLIAFAGHLTLMKLLRVFLPLQLIITSSRCSSVTLSALVETTQHPCHACYSCNIRNFSIAKVEWFKNARLRLIFRENSSTQLSLVSSTRPRPLRFWLRK